MPIIDMGDRKLYIKQKYIRFVNRYLENGMNATEAYQVIFKPKTPENAYSYAYRTFDKVGVKEYLDYRLAQINNVTFDPEHIKTTLHNKSISAHRDSDKLRALEIMAKISGMLKDAPPNTINLIGQDVLNDLRSRIQANNSASLPANNPDTPLLDNHNQGNTVNSDLSITHNIDYNTLDNVSPDDTMTCDDGTQGSGVEEPPPTP